MISISLLDFSGRYYSYIYVRLIHWSLGYLNFIKELNHLENTSPIVVVPSQVESFIEAVKLILLQITIFINNLRLR